MPAEPLLTFGSCRSPGTDLPLTSPGPYCPRTVRFATSSTVIHRIDLNTGTFCSHTESASKAIGGSMAVKAKSLE